MSDVSYRLSLLALRRRLAEQLRRTDVTAWRVKAYGTKDERPPSASNPAVHAVYIDSDDEVAPIASELTRAHAELILEAVKELPRLLHEFEVVHAKWAVSEAELAVAQAKIALEAACAAARAREDEERTSFRLSGSEEAADQAVDKRLLEARSTLRGAEARHERVLDNLAAVLAGMEEE